MNVFWKSEPLTEHESTLLNLCLEAHVTSVHRDNISTAVVRNVAAGSFNFTNAVAAALLSVGGQHAPLIGAWEALLSPVENLKQHIELGGIVPGWGSSFQKEGIDPVWQSLSDHIATQFHEQIGRKIEEVTLALHEQGKQIYPNIACLTAATGIILKMPPQLVGWFFIQGRLAEWGKVFFSVLAGTQKRKEDV